MKNNLKNCIGSLYAVGCIDCNGKLNATRVDQLMEELPVNYSARLDSMVNYYKDQQKISGFFEVAGNILANILGGGKQVQCAPCPPPPPPNYMNLLLMAGVGLSAGILIKKSL